jgi:hypothetical protein
LTSEMESRFFEKVFRAEWVAEERADKSLIIFLKFN